MAIADDLRGRFANDDFAARKEVTGIIQRYFNTDLSVIIEEAFTGKRGQHPKERPIYQND